MLNSIGIIGAGGWGIALAKLLADKREQVTLWCHRAESFRELQENRESRTYLTGIVLPSSVEFTRSIEAAVTDKSLVICALPSHAVRGIIASAASYLSAETAVLCGTKGLEEESLKTMGEVLAETLGEPQQHVFLSGPTFALEVARGLPTAVTVAARDEDIARNVQETLSTQNFRVYSSTDIVGVQMGGVIKNIIAIAAGISDGLNLGHNARAALITRGLAEMTRLAIRMGADPMTLRAFRAWGTWC